MIPFPKTASGSDPLTGAPTEIPDPVLQELGIAARKEDPGKRTPEKDP